MEKLKELQKSKAVECLKKLNILDTFIRDFEKQNVVCYFRYYAGHWAWQDEEITAKIKELEEKYGLMVYAVIITETKYETLYDFLYISKDIKDYHEIITATNKQNEFVVDSYSWNKQVAWCSDFGSIVVKASFGGLIRVG